MDRNKTSQSHASPRRPRTTFYSIQARHVNEQTARSLADRYDSSAPKTAETPTPRPTLDPHLVAGFKKWEENDTLLGLVAVGGKVLQLRAKDLLKCFWAGGLDSECAVCGGNFDDDKGPPIRTIACVDWGICTRSDLRLRGIFDNTSSPILRVFNRHMSCLIRSEIKYYAVSHVWHEEIRIAQSNTPGNHTDATVFVLQVVIQTAAEIWAEFRASSSDKHFAWDDSSAVIEVWHDYISAPQWQKPTLERVLLFLPDIYRSGAKTVIHLDDISLAQWIGIWNQDGTLQRAKALRVVVDSAWFHRMWVLLEYLNSAQAGVMLNDYSIVPDPQEVVYDSDGSEDYPSVPTTNLLRTMLKMCRDILTEVSWLEGIDFQKLADDVYPSRAVFELCNFESSHEFNLGGALSQIASRDATYYRDRFIALCDMLHIDAFEDGNSALPDDTIEACKWLWKKCLSKGDYTPLLLKPNGERKPPAGPTWLIGHEQMKENMWNLGATLSPATHNIIVGSNSIKLTMDHIGDLVSTHAMFDDDKSIMEGFKRVLDEYNVLHKKHDGPFDINTFIDTLGRVYGFPAVITDKKVPTTVGEYASETMDLQLETLGPLEALEGLLETIKDLLDAIPRYESSEDMEFLMRDLEMACARMILKLELDDPVSGVEGLSTNIGRTEMIHAFPGGKDIIGSRCPACRESFLFRAELYSHVDITRCKLYRISGLSFEYSGKQGVGLILCGQDIAGRALFATQPCACRVEVAIELSC
ncbi:uncharacterized protein PAC_01142 [Phialocephala subalpina]|uniref:Heterokaryon incompatibility domain-containing protein n=1 Tax=Phialocephala subalpina TaxID=576137 RepID=A0A1L7WER3_9HELO|nr:uncharacterized protein PAC_01142 [Phialocephala subalpina]